MINLQLKNMIDTGHFFGLGGIEIEDVKALNALPKNTKNIQILRKKNICFVCYIG